MTTNANSFSANWVNGSSLYLSQTDYVNTMYDYTIYGTCATAANTAAKNCSLNTVYNNLRAGCIVGVWFTYTNTAENPQLTIAYTTHSIKYNGQLIATSNLDKAGKAGHVTYYMFDGSYWVWMGEDNAFSGDYNDLTNKPTTVLFDFVLDVNLTNQTYTVVEDNRLPNTTYYNAFIKYYYNGDDTKYYVGVFKKGNDHAKGMLDYGGGYIQFDNLFATNQTLPKNYTQVYSEQISAFTNLITTYINASILAMQTNNTLLKGKLYYATDTHILYLAISTNELLTLSTNA